MGKFNLNSMIEKFNGHIEKIAEPQDAAKAKTEFQKLISEIFTTFDPSKADRQTLLSRKESHDSFITICKTLKIEDDPEDCVIAALAYSGRGAVLKALNEYDNALKDFRKSADIASLSPGACEIRLNGVENMARLLMAINRIDESVKCYDEAALILKDSDFSENGKEMFELYAERGCALCRSRTPLKAVEDFNRAIEIYDSFEAPTKHQKKVVIKCLSNRCGNYVAMEKPELAIKDGLRAIELEGGEVTYATRSAMINLGAAYHTIGKLDEAEQYYDNAIILGITMTPEPLTPEVIANVKIDSATLFVSRARIREEYNNLIGALSDLNCAIKIFKTYYSQRKNIIKKPLVTALFGRAEIYTKLNKPEAAAADREEYRKIIGYTLD